MKLQKYLLLVHVVIIVQAADLPKIVPFNSFRDAEAVRKMIAENYNDIVSRADKLAEQKRYIQKQLESYQENEQPADTQCSVKKQFVMLKDQKTIGFIDFVFNQPFTPFGVPTGSIRVLAMDSNYRGNGYGADLCGHACDLLKDMGAHKIGIMTTSEEVWKKFYAKLGFKPSAVGSVGKFDPTFFYNKRLVPPQSWSTWALCVLRKFKKC